VSTVFRIVLIALLALTSGVSAQSKKPRKKQPPPKREATAPADLAALPGFQVELLRTADPTADGSWICMCKDNKGRLIVAGQRGQPILRFTLKGGKVVKSENLKLPISEAMGLLYAFDSLYVNGAGPRGVGLYRCRDTKGTDTFDDVKLLKNFSATGEHGIHGLAVGPDKKLYLIHGNHTDLPKGIAADSPHRNYHEDHLLPRQWDGNGHATGRLAPAGYVLRTDPDGKGWELVLGGFRNAYDIAFNTDGELFTFDSDMEWDWGMPWYRPTRVLHTTSGAEFGWRAGTGKWPDYYPDSLPAVANIGIGSPTGVTFGTGAKFPAKYQKALYVLDWSYGRVIAVHLSPKGSSYTATFENLVTPKGLDGKSAKKPLNVTDIVVGDDGALYFTTGGRNTQAGLYRVSYTGNESTAPIRREATPPVGGREATPSEERAARHALEAFHGKRHPRAIETAWPYLNSDDRFLRYAARIAIESQPVPEWKAKALAETRPNAALTALLALARTGDRNTQPELLVALDRFPISKLNDSQKIDKLRVLSLSFLRQGQPAFAQARKIVAELDAVFPGPNELVNRELAQVLISLGSPKVLTKCLTLMANAKTQEDRLHYLFHLRTLPLGFWTLDQRKEYLAYWTKDRGKLKHPAQLLKWFEEAGRPYADGASFNNFLKHFLAEYVSTFSDAERKALAPTIAAIDKAAAVTITVKPRPFVKQWKMDEAAPLLDRVAKGRNFARGKEAFAAAQCAKCHRFGDVGGGVGPDLTAVASRFDRRAILESVLEPSKVVSEQYQNEQFNTLDGRVIVGRVVDETADSLAIQPDPLDSKRVTIKKADIESRKPSKLSPMPASLADVLTADELLDLVAYLESAGRKNYPAFRK
jgi:putative heme-binding domain-containing protein